MNRLSHLSDGRKIDWPYIAEWRPWLWAKPTRRALDDGAAHREMAGGRGGDGDGLPASALSVRMKAVSGTILVRRRANAPLLSGKRAGECPKT